MNYINKTTGEQISESTYKMLNISAQINFIKVENTINHQIIEHKDDHATIGDALAIVALTPLLIIKSIF